jgi:hypothetical protein
VKYLIENERCVTDTKFELKTFTLYNIESPVVSKV